MVGDIVCIIVYNMLYYDREGHATMVDEIVAQLHGLTPDLIVLSVGGGGLMNGILTGMERVGWNQVPVLAIETQGAHSLYASAKAGKWVELDDITRYSTPITCIIIYYYNMIIHSIARCLGTKRVCQRSYEWLSQHPIIPVTVTDKQALSACINIAGINNMIITIIYSMSLYHFR